MYVTYEFMAAAFMNRNFTTEAPIHLKKELDNVLVFQAELEGSERVLQNIRAMLDKAPASQGAHDALASLECGHK